MTHVLACETDIYGASRIQERAYSRSPPHGRSRPVPTLREDIRAFLLQAIDCSSISQPCSVSGFTAAFLTGPVITSRVLKRQCVARRGKALNVRFHDARDRGEIQPSFDPERFLLFLEVLRSGLEVQARDGADEVQLLAVIEFTLAGWDAYLRRAAKSP